mgnify:CR=1 FL=1
MANTVSGYPALFPGDEEVRKQSGGSSWTGLRPGQRLVLKGFKGDEIAHGRVKSCWRTPNSYTGSEMCQMEFVIDGATYSGRGFGVGMAWSGKRLKRGSR